MEQAINAYYKITASPEFRELERMREKARHDEAQALHHAKMVGREEGRAVGREEGRAEGREEGRAEGAFQNMIASIQNLVDNVGWSVEQALSALNVPEAERQKYRELVRKQ